jgi:uncharacterized protein
VNLVRVTSDNPDDGYESVEYLDYNSDDEAKRLDELYSTVLSNNTPSNLATDGGQTQATFSEFNQSGSGEGSQQTDISQDGSHSNVTHTLFFVTPTKSWGLLKHFAGESPDPDVVANQAYWDLLAIDEASMLTLPNFILAGCGMKSDAQLLVSGDHRQLPPVQQHDWVSETRSTIESTLGYLSGLDYLRVLSGDETVVDAEQFDRFDNQINLSENEMPLIQLNETYRFDQVTADFIQNVVYSSDGIEYTSGKDRDPSQCYIDGGNPALEAIFNSPESIVLVTYDADQHYQQMNPIEAVLSQELLLHHNPELSAGLVTPHNAQRSRLRALLYGLQHDETVDAGGIRLDENTHVETVERFQGGQQDLMVVSATVSDPRYIDSENEFLLEENRANVSFARHKNKLVVLAPKTLFAHIPTEPDIYDEAELWKSISVVGGEAPLDTPTPPAWSGPLSDVLAISDMPDSVDPSAVSVEIYTISSQGVSLLED